ncbi:MAG: hypothetical protein M1823_000812 [Watsoniomyces obsoletus]|nr:MAG: hypothetical protein M1823_000812 [Watsoniomyces obsoletus]
MGQDWTIRARIKRLKKPHEERKTMLDYHAPPSHQHHFPRRPVPGLGIPPSSQYQHQPRLKPLTKIVPDDHQFQQQEQQQQQQQRQIQTHLQPQTQTQSRHYHSRTASSTALPESLPPAIINHPAHSVIPEPTPPTITDNMNPYKPFNRRTLSNGTDSTSTTGAGLIPVRTSSNSSRSAGSQQTSYVALMRRQKATVWCDRSQYEDPRLIAQQKAARMRADREIVGSASRSSGGGGGGASSGSFTGGNLSARGKIRHHGKGSSVGTGLTPTALVGGVGVVPLRLSASEVGDEGGYEDDGESTHLRTMTNTGGGGGGGGGGRSSLGGSSARQTPTRISDSHGRIPSQGGGYQNPYTGGGSGSGLGRFSGDATTPSSNGSGGSDSMGDPTPIPHSHHHQQHYHHQPSQQNQHQTPQSTSGDYFAHPQGGSGNGSGSSGERERERSFGGLGRMVEHSTESSSTLRDHRQDQDQQHPQQQQQQQRQGQVQQDHQQQHQQQQHQPEQNQTQQQQRQQSGVGRRDSVDERTSTMTGIRLFVANPDP